MRSAAALALVFALAGPLRAQEPTVSRTLSTLSARDTVVAVWFFGRPTIALDRVEAAVRSIGGVIRQRSRWLHAVSADVPTTALPTAETRREFRHLQLVARVRGRPELSAPAVLPRLSPFGASPYDSAYGPSAMPFRRLHLFPLVSRGLDGTGVTIAMLDTGFETGNPAFATTKVIAERDYVFGDSVVRNQAQDDPLASRHGTETWSLLAANLPGQVVGVAPRADYVLAKTEDIRSETRVEEDNWVAALEWADSLGATVVSSSVGYLSFDGGFSYQASDLNGDVAVTTVAADMAAARGILVVTAAGNAGPAFRSLITPADGDSVLTAGAEDSLGNTASFSSRGPTADGRMKPDLMAPGVSVYVVDAYSGTGFARVNGTSFSTPLLAGVGALYRQAHPLDGPMDALTALRATGDNRQQPDSIRGWGRPDAAVATLFPSGLVAVPTDSVLMSVTPTFSWNAPQASTLVGPLTARLVVATDTLLANRVLDTTLTGATVAWAPPLQPGATLAYQVSVRTDDSISVSTAIIGPLVAPSWATLISPDNPDGVTTRDPRPTFRWSSPDVIVPPGPFRYDLEILRADDGVRELIVRDLGASQYTPDRDLERNTPYRWRVTARLGADSVVVASRGTFVIIDDTAPATTLLFQNFPNPFPSSTDGSAVTCIWFDLATEGSVRLDVLDLRGHIVKNLVPGDEFPVSLPPGRYGRPATGAPGQCDPRLTWDGAATNGTPVSRGVYVIRLVTPDGTYFKRVAYMGPR